MELLDKAKTDIAECLQVSFRSSTGTIVLAWRSAELPSCLHTAHCAVFLLLEAASGYRDLREVENV